MADAAAAWRIAHESQVLDGNSSYAYLLWFSHFARTSAVAKLDDEVVAFATGFILPESLDTVMIWQIAVRKEFQGRGIALGILNSVLERNPKIRWLKTSIARSNTVSAAVFTSFADDRQTIISHTSMFSTSDFPDAHEPEALYVIGPLDK